MQESNLHRLRIFCTVVDSGGFSRAAEKLYISQPAVSVQVRELERTYGAPLIERAGRSFHLTEAGRLVYDYARRLLGLAQELDNALADIKGLVAGRLLVGASTTVGEYILPPVMGEFKRRYPGVQLELDIANTTAIVQRIEEHSLDIGLVGDDEAITPQLQVEPYRIDEIVLIVRPDHRFLRMGKVPAAELAREELVLREPGSATRKYAEQALAAAGVEVKVTMELGSNEAVKRAVAAGLGVSMLSRHAVEVDVAAGRLAVTPVQGLQCRRNLCIVYRKARHFTRAQQAFLELLHETS